MLFSTLSTLILAFLADVSHGKDVARSFKNNPVKKSKGYRLPYHGGLVLANVEVFTVFYGNDTLYQNEVNKFYAGVVNSSLFDMLGQYSTPKQKIGRGRFTGSYVITNVITSIVQSDVEAVVKSLVLKGVINVTANTYVPVHLSPSVTIMDQCTSFCAFHDSVNTAHGIVAYGVIPDQSGDCLSCGDPGGNNMTINAIFDSSSHELSEAVTDPLINKGWMDADTNEVGDLCNSEYGWIRGGDGEIWFIQGEWSNTLGACWNGNRTTPDATATSTAAPSSTKTTTSTTKTTSTSSTTKTKTTSTTKTTASTTTTSSSVRTKIPQLFF
ncbi:hypothetical protein BC830DRAFT_1163790 [Chytriomyces sp. MP71]|nr:hypothetical protein BC830DRAFT_1163790 [Chytriomyces sp. MP71]